MRIHARLQWFLSIVLLLFASGSISAQPLFDEIIVFGDSVSDTGNVSELTGGAFAGEPYFGGRFSNGPVWVEHLALGLGLVSELPTENAPFPAPILAMPQGTNYAHGGAQTGPRFSRPISALTATPIPNIGLQVDTFLAHLAASGQALNGDELLVVQGGSNNNSGHLAALQMAEHVATLAAAGGKWFLVPNLWRVSQDPFAVNDDRRWDLFVDDFNSTLEKELMAVKEGHEDISIMLMDWFKLYDNLISSEDLQEFYGLTNVTDPVCPACAAVTDPAADDMLAGNPDEFLYWDAFHFTRVGQQIFGEAAANFVSNGVTNSGYAVNDDLEPSSVPEPSSLALFAFVLFTFAKARRQRSVPERPLRRFPNA